jgi:hypothetical protein
VETVTDEVNVRKKKALAGGSHLSARKEKKKKKREREPEREGCRGWAGLAGLDRPELGPGHGPGWAGHFYTLFFLFIFSFPVS